MAHWTRTYHWLRWPSLLAASAFFALAPNEHVLAQPANNNCVTAQPIIIPAGGNVCVTSSSASATSSNTTNTCNTSAVNEVWFTYIVAGPSNTITVTPTGGTPIQQPVVTITDAGCASATYNACNAAATVNGTASVSWAFATGTQVSISVAGIQGDGGFQICITSATPPPTPGSSCGGANPTCSTAPFSVASTAGIPSSGISPPCFNIGGIPQLVQNDLWYVFTVGQSGTLGFTATLTGAAEFDWAVYNITNGCPGTIASCNYFFSNGNSGAIGLRTPAGGEFNAPINVTAGNTYAIMIDNYSNNGVGFNFAWGGTFQMAPTTSFVINNPAACNSLTTTFTNNTVGAATYNWNFGNGQTSTAQTPPPQTYNTPGTYFVTLTGTSAAGCPNSFSGSVSVYPNPTVNLAVTNESCVGACDGQLVASASGTGPFTYTWPTLGGSSTTQTGLCAANYTVSVTDQSNNCSGGNNATVGSGAAVADASINPAGPFCSNSPTLNLTAAQPGGTWSGTGITNTNAGTFNPAVAGPGTWTINYTIPGACGNTGTTTITVNPNLSATITAAGPFCTLDAPVNLVAASAGGTWSGTGITNAATGTFDPAVAGMGNWTVTYTIAGACGSSDTEVMIVGPQQDATISPVGPFCASDPSINLTAVSGGGIWSGTGITNANTGTFSPSTAGAGNWTITYTIAGACGDVNSTTISVGNVTFNQSSVNVTCNGDNSGQITISNAVGAPPLSYSIDGGMNTQPTGLFSGLGPGNYSLVATDANGCSSIVVPLQITEPTALIVSASMDQQSSCGNPNGEVTAVAQGGTVIGSYQYLWDTNPTQSTASATGLSPGTYTVTVTDNNGCTATASVSVTATPGFTASMSNATDATCNGVCSGSATAVVSNSAALPVSYLWNDPSNQTLPTAIGLCAGSYQVTVTDNVGCIATATAVVSEPTAVQAQILSSISTVCIGQSADLSAALSGGLGPYSGFLWSSLPIDPSLSPSTQNPTVSPLVNTTYSFVATDANGCPSTPVSLSLNVSSPLGLSVSSPIGGNTGICLNGSTAIDLVATGGDGNYSYYLLPDLTNPINLPYQVQPSTTTSYDFMVNDGCSSPPASASSLITVHPLPQVAFAANDSMGCIPFSLSFSDLSAPPAATWSWDFGDPNSLADTSIAQNPYYQYTEVGTFDVTLTVTTANGCVATLVQPSFIETFQPPVAAFEYDPHQALSLDPTIRFTDQSTGNVTDWEWEFGDGDVSFDQNPSHSYLDTGNHVITLHVISAEGCTSLIRHNVYIRPTLTLYIPNSFTPDRDHINDGFRAYGEGYDWSTYQLVIFDRWGTEIFKTNDIEDEWRGTYKNNKVEAGLYAWRILISDFNGRVYPFNGHIKLIR